MKHFILIVSLIILNTCVFVLVYSIHMSKLKVADLEYQVKMNVNDIHVLTIHKHAKCQCEKEPAQQ